MKLYKYSVLITMCLCSMVFNSCSSHKKTHSEYLFAASTWNRFVPAIDSFAISDTKTTYDLDISLSVWDNFEHSLVPLQVIITYPNGQENSFIKYMSVRDIEGKHLGKVTGDVWTVSMNVFSNRGFTEKGNYIVNIQNLTQYYDLPNVHSVTLDLYPHKK